MDRVWHVSHVATVQAVSAHTKNGASSDDIRQKRHCRSCGAVALVFFLHRRSISKTAAAAAARHAANTVARRLGDVSTICSAILNHTPVLRCLQEPACFLAESPKISRALQWASTVTARAGIMDRWDGCPEEFWEKLIRTQLLVRPIDKRFRGPLIRST